MSSTSHEGLCSLLFLYGPYQTPGFKCTMRIIGRDGECSRLSRVLTRSGHVTVAALAATHQAYRPSPRRWVMASALVPPVGSPAVSPWMLAAAMQPVFVQTSAAASSSVLSHGPS